MTSSLVLFFNQLNLGTFDYSNFVFTVQAATNMTTLKFGFRNDLDFFAFDDISVIPAPMAAPTIVSPHLASGALQFNFVTMTNVQYQVQYRTNLVLGSWVWFRAETLPAALAYFHAMAGGGISTETTALLDAQVFAPGKLALMAIAVLCLFAPRQAYEWSASLTWPKALILVPAFALALMAMFSQTLNPFLYFQF